ncbi:hypothetical protein JOQ06_011798 [Pogonophryne albipinna]|uniref:Uncharacterized protein n=1 Tax=Pogonophryne albipinna TaxID=1090488 RepID=A0AAD6BFR3_9TELE|nr:hypothetical protein JOQ06_011798 [Pogonophryne albipinna]
MSDTGFGSSSGKQRLVKSERARVAEEGRMERGTEAWKRASWGKGGMGGGSKFRALSAKNNKQAFSYSNKYQASGEHGGAADKEEAWGESWRIYTEASSAPWKGAEQAVKDLQ